MKHYTERFDALADLMLFCVGGGVMLNLQPFYPDTGNEIVDADVARTGNLSPTFGRTKSMIIYHGRILMSEAGCLEDFQLRRLTNQIVLRALDEMSLTKLFRTVQGC